ncbi:hypothetical protein MDAP_002807 [Mitosporidium daphniae]
MLSDSELGQIPEESLVESAKGIVFIDEENTDGTNISPQQLIFLKSGEDPGGWANFSFFERKSPNVLRSCIQSITSRLIWHKNKMAEKLVLERHKSAQERALAEPELLESNTSQGDSFDPIYPQFLMEAPTPIRVDRPSIIRSYARKSTIGNAYRLLHAEKSDSEGYDSKAPIMVDNNEEIEANDDHAVEAGNIPQLTSDVASLVTLEQTSSKMDFPVVLENVRSDYYSAEYCILPPQPHSITQHQYSTNTLNPSTCLLCLQLKAFESFLPCGDSVCYSCISSIRGKSMQICPVCLTSLREFFRKPFDLPEKPSLVEKSQKRTAIRSKTPLKLPGKISSKTIPTHSNNHLP